ncbi:DUF4350 domain-containing protein [Tsuneonella amylolytica]|uniref:DUF4350 domain-containing protein n=1 Tax=Tsuneonella amylolytica TaxID=2338327 RepID=UPI000EA94DD9|nr:DUF4350 domain-containing protein [Tsuneonella amylolytica]
MNRGAFDRRTVLGLVLLGALAFVAMLWFIGQGDTDGGPENGQAHAAGHGLAGYAALADLLGRQGHTVSLSRNEGRLDDEALLILTPTLNADPDKLAEIVEDRRYVGPTLLILPKWFAFPLPAGTRGSKEGWVQLLAASKPGWAARLDGEIAMKPEIGQLAPGSADWTGLGLSGALPRPDEAMGIEGGDWATLVRDSRGRDIVAYAADDGCYPVLDGAAGFTTPGEDACESDKWNVTVAFEPDLFNNYGMADRNRALLAAKVVELAREGQDVPVVFDLTLAGLGGAKNLLTLAFQPPFLAATLCLLLAAAVIGWRAFGRFGPAVAERRSIAFGKTRLAANAGGIVRRSGRLYLLSGPYAALVGGRIAAALGLRRPDPDAIDAAVARLRPDAPPFSALVRRLETAQGAGATLRAAHALHALERDLRR